MIRAGVFIGVNRTGGLEVLTDAAASAQRMHSWALSQGIADDTHAKLLTDADNRKVGPDLIYDVIQGLIDGPGVDQLIVYFAGHGVNINRSEHWLLSDAPRRSNAAVNVSGSAELAQYCGIRHVIFISDACRVAPEGIQAQNVRGGDIFPNDSQGRIMPVDRFFACGLGRTATEILDPVAAARNYTALYTSAMLDALNGTQPDVLESLADDSAYYVTARGLNSYLQAEVVRRVVERGLQHKVNQDPEAIITSDKAWISRITRAVPAASETNPPTPPDTLHSLTNTLVRSAAAGKLPIPGPPLDSLVASEIPGAQHLAATAERVATPFGPDHFESRCGFKVRGARIVEAFAPRAATELLGDEGHILRINALTDNVPASVLLHFEGGIGAVLPALPGFIGALTFEAGELVDVAYEPSRNHWRWSIYQDRARDIRALRAIAASSSQHGRFQLERDDADPVARRMQFEKSVDPTLAIYAAYAYHDLQHLDRIRLMSRYLRDDHEQTTFFDLELLSRALIAKRVEPHDRVLPFVPLLSQGWSLLNAHRFQLHPALQGLETTMQQSLWSLFNLEGIEKIKTAMRSQEVR